MVDYKQRDYDLVALPWGRGTNVSVAHLEKEWNERLEGRRADIIGS